MTVKSQMPELDQGGRFLASPYKLGSQNTPYKLGLKLLVLLSILTLPTQNKRFPTKIFQKTLEKHWQKIFA